MLLSQKALSDRRELPVELNFEELYTVHCGWTTVLIFFSRSRSRLQSAGPVSNIFIAANSALILLQHPRHGVVLFGPSGLISNIIYPAG